MPIHSDAANKGLRGYSFLHLPPSSVVTKAKPRFFIPVFFVNHFLYIHALPNDVVKGQTIARLFGFGIY